MPHFDFLSDDARVPDLLAKVPGSGVPFVQLVQDAMRKSVCELSAAEREVLATWVSWLNGCDYCVAAHANIALALHADEALVRDIRERGEIDRAEPTLRAMLELGRKSTRHCAELGEAEIDAVREAGWSEQAILDAMVVIGAFNLINRLVTAAGLELDEQTGRAEAKVLADQGYLGVVNMLQREQED